MMRIPASSTFLLLFLAIAAAAVAQTDRPPDTREGRLVRNEEGFSLDLDGGFELGKYHDGYYLLGSRTVPGLILVKDLPGLTAGDLNRNLQSGYTDRTVQLTPDGIAVELEKTGGIGRLVDVRGFLYEREVRGLLAGYLRPGGGGLLLFAVTSPQQWPQLSPIAAQVARSVRVFNPDPQELIRTWKERLSGFQLIHAPASDAGDKSAAVAAMKQPAYYLCGDGSFRYEEGVEAGSRRPDSYMTASAGSWKIVPRQRWAELVLAFRDGREQSFRLTREDHETFLDGERYFVLSYDRCP
jgi:hypothetical protein